MKVLHFSSAKTWRGGEQQIVYLVEALNKMGVQQWIFCRKGSALENYCQFHDWPHFTYWKGFSINPIIGYQLKKWCTQLSIDVVHLHDSHSHTFAYMSALVGNETPYVLSRRVDFRVKNSWFSKKKYNHASIKAILSVSQKVEDILAPAIQNKNLLKVVHSGIDLSKFRYKDTSILRQECQLAKTTKLIANVAAIAPHKDYFTFVDTAAILLKEKRDLHFFIIGADGGDASMICSYIEAKKLTGSITLTGFRKDISQILPEIDVFLFTSKEEGLGTSVIDALACGVPVVATKAGGIPEIIEHQKNGLLATVGDSEVLATYVKNILEDTVLAQQYITEGKKTAALYDKRYTAEKTLVVYKSIVDNN